MRRHHLRPEERFAGLVRLQHVATASAAALAVIGTLVGGTVGRVAGGALVVVLVGMPVVRVAWLGGRWWRRGDRRFAAAAAGLLGVVALAAAVALLG